MFWNVKLTVLVAASLENAENAETGSCTNLIDHDIDYIHKIIWYSSMLLLVFITVIIHSFSQIFH